MGVVPRDAAAWRTGPAGVVAGTEMKQRQKNAARMPQINERNRLPWSALRCHRDRLSTIILAPFLAVEKKVAGTGTRKLYL